MGRNRQPRCFAAALSDGRTGLGVNWTDNMSTYYYRERSAFSFAPRNRITYAVQRLILANVLVFAAQLMVSIPIGNAYILGGVAAEWLSFRGDMVLRGAIWQPFTYMFLHADLSHLFWNMLGLYFFGPDVERVLGTRQFFRFYVLCGALGVFASILPALVGLPSGPIVGASGATLGVLVACAVAYPEKEAFFLPLPFPLNIRVLVLIFVVLSLVQSGSGVSVATHLGGITVGFVYMKAAPRIRDWLEAWQKKRPQSKDHLDVLGEAVEKIFKFEDEKRRRK